MKSLISNYKATTVYIPVSIVLITALAFMEFGSEPEGGALRRASRPFPSPSITITNTWTTILPTGISTETVTVTAQPPTPLPSPTLSSLPSPEPTGPTPSPSFTTPTPPTFSPRNKAHGLKDACFVTRNKNVLKVPCHVKTSGAASEEI